MWACKKKGNSFGPIGNVVKKLLKIGHMATLAQVLYVQEVMPILYSNLLYKMGHYFLDTQYEDLPVGGFGVAKLFLSLWAGTLLDLDFTLPDFT